MKRKKNIGPRLGRIENKCDMILERLTRLERERRPDIDTLIERIHRTARSMRRQAIEERDAYARKFGRKRFSR